MNNNLPKKSAAKPIIIISRAAISICSAIIISGCTNVESIPKLTIVTQSDINHMASTLDVTYSLVDNRDGEHCNQQANNSCFKAKLTLTSPSELLVKDWQIYFSSIWPISHSTSPSFKVSQVNGDLHKIEPTKLFSGFYSEISQEVNFIAKGWHVSESDPLPNYYVTGMNLTAVTIDSTRPTIDKETGLEQLPYVTPFTDHEKQFKRIPTDKTVQATAQVLYNNNLVVTNDKKNVDAAIIPTPTKTILNESGQRLDLSSGLSFHFDNIHISEVSAGIKRLALLGVKTNTNGVNANISVSEDKFKPAGSYQLVINQKGIQIDAVDSAGAFYGIQSIASLLKAGATSIPMLTVIDSPRFNYRGMHIDVARNFNSTEYVIKLLDQMGAYKLNKLHFNLADDEGWRLAIDGLPELTEIGSKRCHDPQERTCLSPQLGHGVDTQSTVSGFYNRSQYIEILKEAKARHIQVIPSFDMPGHARAAVKSMQARYYNLMELGKNSEANKYLLNDFSNTLSYSTVQAYNDNTINVCMESSYVFIEKVMDEMINMHKAAGHPLELYHMGGEETEHAWKGSKACKGIEDSYPSFENQHGYFIQRLADILDQRGVGTGGWSDAMERAVKEDLPNNVQVNGWASLILGTSSTNDLANRGWDLVLSNPDAAYFDLPYEADPKERGYYWASRGVNTAKVFSMMPENLPLMAEMWKGPNGEDVTINDTLQKDHDGKIIHSPLKSGVRFIGIQGQLWGETTRSDKQKEYMAFPRIIALAERAWHKADWEVDYNYQGAVYHKNSGVFTDKLKKNRDMQFSQFANTLGHKELAKLDLANIFYRIPTVGAKIENGYLSANILFPGLKIEYRVNKGYWMKYSEKVAVNGIVQVRAISANGQRKGRTLMVQ